MDNLHDIITMEYHADISKNMERPITRGIKGKSQENITMWYSCQALHRHTFLSMQMHGEKTGKAIPNS